MGGGGRGGTGKVLDLLTAQAFSRGPSKSWYEMLHLMDWLDCFASHNALPHHNEPEQTLRNVSHILLAHMLKNNNTSEVEIWEQRKWQERGRDRVFTSYLFSVPNYLPSLLYFLHGVPDPICESEAITHTFGPSSPIWSPLTSNDLTRSQPFSGRLLPHY